MECNRFFFRGDEVQGMFERQIHKDDLLDVLRSGEVIVTYPDDVPFPSCLVLGFVQRRPLHVVVAIDQTSGTCHIVTVYQPDASQWGPDFKTRKP